MNQFWGQNFFYKYWTRQSVINTRCEKNWDFSPIFTSIKCVDCFPPSPKKCLPMFTGGEERRWGTDFHDIGLVFAFAITR
jgi:hypothetical protein